MIEMFKLVCVKVSLKQNILRKRELKRVVKDKLHKQCQIITALEYFVMM